MCSVDVDADVGMDVDADVDADVDVGVDMGMDIDVDVDVDVDSMTVVAVSLGWKVVCTGPVPPVGKTPAVRSLMHCSSRQHQWQRRSCLLGSQ